MTESGDQEVAAPKHELTPLERLVGLEKAKLHTTLANGAYNAFVWPAVWFKENVSFPDIGGYSDI
jgi:hypothetical protein